LKEAGMLGPISHVALIVSDPARTAGLFQQLFDAPTVQRVDAEGHDETFVRLGETWFLLAAGSMERPRTGDHIAFRVSKAAVDATVAKLKAMGLEYILARSDTSLYFFDYDNHVFELDTTDLDAELQALKASRS
jgi:catechol 2,3-dioxygenase-like lactoylglutathione lyase family enzyme